MTKLKKLFEYALDRMGEPSTWQGLVFLTPLIGAQRGQIFILPKPLRAGRL